MKKAIRILLCLCVFCIVQQSQAQEVAVAGITFPNTITDDQWKVFIENVTANSSPRLTLKMMIRGEAGSEEMMVQALRRGRLQLAAPSLAGATSLVPELAVLQLPFLFDSTDQMDFVYDSILPNYFRTAFSARGLIFLHWIDSGWLGFYGPEPYLDPARVKGVKLRVAPTDAARLMAEVLEADTIYVPYTEIVPALQTGLIEGGMTSDYAFVTGGLAEEVQAFTLTKHSYDTGMMLANEAWFELLNQTNKKVIEEAYGNSQDFRMRSRAYSQSQLMGLHERTGTKVIEFSESQRQQWVQATASTHGALLERIGAPAIALYDIINDAKAQYDRMNRPKQ